MTTAVAQDRVDELFADARDVHAQAVERLEQGDIRDAAEKAWCARHTERRIRKTAQYIADAEATAGR